MPAEPRAQDKQPDSELVSHANDQEVSSEGRDNGNGEAVEHEEDEEDEPRLKYTKLTASLASVYRNGDDTSTFLVAGDKMVGLRTTYGVSPRSLTGLTGDRDSQWQHSKEYRVSID